MTLIHRLKRLLGMERPEPKLEENLDGSLRGHALRRALRQEKPRSATPHDWEDQDAWEASMKRLEEKMQDQAED